MNTLYLKYSVKASLFVTSTLLFTQEAFAIDKTEYLGIKVDDPTQANESGDIIHGIDADSLNPHAGDAYHGAEKASAAGLPQMDPTWFPSQIFWLCITFLCLYVIFSRKILPEISSTLETRRQQIEGDLSNAQELKEEAESVHEAYNKILNDARQQSTTLFGNVEENIKSKTNKKLEAFKARSTKKTIETESIVEKAKEAIMGDMHAIAADIAIVAADKMVGIKADPAKVKNTVKNIGRKAA